MKASLLQRRLGGGESAEALRERREAILAELGDIDAQLTHLEVAGDGKEIEGYLTVASEHSQCIKPYSLGSSHFSASSSCTSTVKWTYYAKYDVLLAPHGYCTKAKAETGSPVDFDLCQYSSGDYNKDKYHFKFDCDKDAHTCEGKIKSKKTHECLSFAHGYFYLQNCDSSDRTQQFTLGAATPSPTPHPTRHPTRHPTPSPTSSGGKVHIKHILSKKCMDVDKDDHLQISTCDNSKDQTWKYSNGKIKTKNGDECITITGDVADGAKLRLKNCDGGDDQKWELSPKGWFKSKVNDHFCIDVPGSATTTEGAKLQLGSCATWTLASDQRWELHDA